MAARKGNSKGSGKSASKPRGRKPAVEADDSPKSRHNIRITKKAAAEYASRYNRILDDKASYDGARMEECKELIAEAASQLGCSKKIARTALKEQRVEMKREEREREMEPEERADLDKLRDALGLFADTPLGGAAMTAAGGKGKDEGAGDFDGP